VFNNTCSNVDADAADVVASSLDLACVNARPDLDGEGV
jgi:hypothetical protein